MQINRILLWNVNDIIKWMYSLRKHCDHEIICEIGRGTYSKVFEGYDASLPQIAFTHSLYLQIKILQ